MANRRQIHVAIVAASPRIIGGQSVQAQTIIAGFSGDAEVVAWLVPIDPTLPRPFDALQRVKYVRTLLTQLLYWPLLFRELRRADVVHVFSASYLSFVLSPLPAIVIARMLGKPVLLNYHSGEALDHLTRSPLARIVLRRAVQLNVVPSRFLEAVCASFGIPANVIFNSIDFERFPYRQRNPLRPRLVSTRSLEPMYNVACTLHAFAIVQRHHPDATLTIVGGGSQAATLQQLALDLSLQHVRFVGSVSPQVMAGYYDDADIYVQTPNIDNMPLSVLEAFASGLPVVSTNIGGVPAILADGDHGYLASADDATAIAARVLDILAQPEEARRRAAAARATCDRYEWAAVREGWVHAYRSLVAVDHPAMREVVEGQL